MSRPPDSTVFKLHDLKVSCKSCSLSRLCLPHGLNEEELARLDGMIERKTKYDRGAALYRSGEPMRAIYAIRSGSFKTFMTTPDGAEQITGFHFPGELLGIDALADEHHHCSAVALETSTVCALPVHDFEHLCATMPELHRQFRHLIGQEINHEHELLLSLGQMRGDERLATFLLNLSERLRARGFSHSEFNLSMPRHDLANYLGLAVETLSRIFSRLQDEGVLKANRRNIRILDFDRLRSLAHQPTRARA